jgi:hypothetical protein
MLIDDKIYKTYLPTQNGGGGRFLTETRFRKDKSDEKIWKII